MQIIGTMDDLDRKLDEIKLAAAQSDTMARQVFAGFEMDVAQLNAGIPADPFSDEYYYFQMELYKKIAGKNYLVSNEVSAFDVDAMIRRPFPFSSGSTAIAGMHFSAMGFVIGNLRLPPGARVLEFGPGWGNTTLALASLGFQVTAVDIEANFCELIRKRAVLQGVTVEVKNLDFFSCEDVVEPYDAVLFYECFHHCSDHMRLLRGLHRAVKPQGRVFLGAEPIKPDFPLPWGLRLDGESLWAIRQNGWMELGFNNTYFAEALRQTGWHGSVQVSHDVGWANLWTLERYYERDVIITVENSSIGTQVGILQDDTIFTRGSGLGYVVYGPRIPLGAGLWSGDIHLKAGAPCGGTFVIDVCSDFGRNIHASKDIVLEDNITHNILSVPFFLSDACSNIEVRLFSKHSKSIYIESIGFSRKR